MAHKQTGNQRWQRDIQFLSEYEKRQNSVRGGLIDPMLFNILSGSGPDIRLGAGFTQAEKTALGFLGSDRSRRNVLKEEMKNAEQGIASGKTYSGQAGSANHDLQNAAYITAAAPAAAGAVAGTAVGATIGATLGAHAAAGLAGTAVGSVAAGATGAAAGGIAGGIGGGIAGGVLGAASVAALPLAAVAIVMLIINYFVIGYFNKTPLP